MVFELRKISIKDDRDIFEMLQEIPKDENGFINSINGRHFEEYKQWLVRSEEASRSVGLEDWKVPQTIYWLYADSHPVGFGKLRHYLTDKLREEGGHGGYAIRPCERNRGFGTVLLKMMIEEAAKMNMDKLLLTIRINNAASLKVAFNNNGMLEKSNDERHFIWIDCQTGRNSK